MKEKYLLDKIDNYNENDKLSTFYYDPIQKMLSISLHLLPPSTPPPHQSWWFE